MASRAELVAVAVFEDRGLREGRVSPASGRNLEARQVSPLYNRPHVEDGRNRVRPRLRPVRDVGNAWHCRRDPAGYKAEIDIAQGVFNQVWAEQGGK